MTDDREAAVVETARSPTPLLVLSPLPPLSPAPATPPTLPPLPPLSPAPAPPPTPPSVPPIYSPFSFYCYKPGLQPRRLPVLEHVEALDDGDRIEVMNSMSSSALCS